MSERQVYTGNQVYGVTLWVETLSDLRINFLYFTLARTRIIRAQSKINYYHTIENIVYYITTIVYTIDTIHAATKYLLLFRT